jgi:7-carboxy-7-deazaguanine synthase
MLKLSPNPIFKSIQGEGGTAGTPMTFIRLAGCNVNCPNCDTDYSNDSQMSVDDIGKIVSDQGLKNVWITGGEPTMQDIQPLIWWLGYRGYIVHVATSNPIHKLEMCYVSFSPHEAASFTRDSKEIKLVHGLNGFNAEKYFITFRKQFNHYRQPVYVQPLWGKDKQAVELVMKYPNELRLSYQLHKTLHMP